MCPTVIVISLILYAFAVAEQIPETVEFQSGDGKTKLVGFLYKPDTPGPHPAVVMLHGRGGLYSTKAEGVYNGETLNPRHKFWGEYWAERGYLGLLIDSFGPRGFPTGFAAGTIKERPDSVDPVRMRTLDAYAGLGWLRRRSDVRKNNVFLQGWSNGATTTLAALATNTPGLANPSVETGFRAAICLYPACAPISGFFGQSYKTYAPFLLLLGSGDREVKPAGTIAWSEVMKSNLCDFQMTVYPEADHAYDTPIDSKQNIAANKDAFEDTQKRAEAFFAKYSHHRDQR